MVKGVSTAALFVTAMLFVTTLVRPRGSSKSNAKNAGQSDCCGAPFVTLTLTSCGGRVSGSRKVLLTTAVLLAESVPCTVAVKLTPLVGAPASEKINVLVTEVLGAAATVSVWVAVSAPLSVTERKTFVSLSDETTVRLRG